jgi:hypothetical protein
MEQGEKREEGEEVSVARGELWGSSITSSNSVICERVSSKLNKKEKEREWFWKFAPTYTERGQVVETSLENPVDRANRLLWRGERV